MRAMTRQMSDMRASMAAMSATVTRMGEQLAQPAPTPVAEPVTWDKVQGKPETYPSSVNTLQGTSGLGRSMMTVADASSARQAIGAQPSLSSAPKAEMEGGTATSPHTMDAQSVKWAIDAHARNAPMLEVTTLTGAKIPAGSLQSMLAAIAKLRVL